MKVLMTENVGELLAGQEYDLRDGYALALINRNQATDPVATVDVPEIEVVVESTPVVETSTEPPTYFTMESDEDDDE